MAKKKPRLVTLVIGKAMCNSCEHEFANQVMCSVNITDEDIDLVGQRILGRTMFDTIVEHTCACPQKQTISMRYQWFVRKNYDPENSCPDLLDKKKVKHG